MPTEIGFRATKLLDGNHNILTLPAMQPLQNLSKYNIQLASASPRRRQLLEMMGIQFSTNTIEGIDETCPASILAEDVAAYLSTVKAAAYQANGLSDNDLVITADTIVLCNGKVLGKPADKDEAHDMLKLLSGNIHNVITGVTITTAHKQSTFSVTTEVEFAHLCDEEINFYIDHFRPFDKAGAYGIQEWIGCIGIKGIRGSYYNVMGLPLHRLYNELKQF